jgi:uncharacterized protein YjeT (DUF2065 family)
MKTLLTLIGLVLILEGLPYMAFPEFMKDWLRQLAEAEPDKLRVMGLSALAAGLLLCWFAQRSGLF